MRILVAEDQLELPGEARLLHTVRGMGWVLKEDA